MLGPETAPADPVPVQVPGLTDVKAVAAGGGHSLALKSDGTVWAWGWNGDGQLGDGTTRSRTAPVQVSGLTGVVRIAAGGAHSLAVKDDGTVWAWGSNAGGQLGDGTTMDRLTPVQVKTLSGATTVAAGRFHSLALKEDGTLWAWGDDQFGQLGDAVELPPPVWRAGRLGPMQAGGLSGVAKIAAGTTHNLALKTDGTLWAWGENSYGQLGNGIARPWDWPARSKPVQVTGPAAIAEIAGDGSLSLAVTDDGSVWTWGVDDSGWQAVPVRVEGLSGVAVAAAACGFYSYPFEFPEYGLAGRPGPYYLAVQSDGNLWEWGARYGGSYFGRPSPVRAFTEVAAAAPGLLRNLVLKRDGTVWEWKTTASGPSPVNGLTNTVAVTATDCIEEPCCCSLALKRDGTVWLWEAPPRFGRLPQRIAPAPLAGLDDVTAIASRGNHHIALKRDGTVWEWFIYEGNATKSLVPVPVAGLTDIIMIAAGAGHGLALRRDGTVWAWGENVYGQLGTQSITARTVPVQVVAPAP
jgi:alpha-tubulin suppressor-like RCC1 family protein